ncbi:hypothetical protein FGB62_17g011 [Gracilaria domingensis]|nr:hypothetical protein FGB62_17g011 [Gracilaria domingensis]
MHAAFRALSVRLPVADLLSRELILIYNASSLRRIWARAPQTDKAPSLHSSPAQPAAFLQRPPDRAEPPAHRGAAPLSRAAALVAAQRRVLHQGHVLADDALAVAGAERQCAGGGADWLRARHGGAVRCAEGGDAAAVCALWLCGRRSEEDAVRSWQGDRGVLERAGTYARSRHGELCFRLHSLTSRR